MVDFDFSAAIGSNDVQGYDDNPETNNEVQDVMEQPETQIAAANELAGQSENADVTICQKETTVNVVHKNIDLVDRNDLKTINRFNAAFRGQSNSERKSFIESVKEYGITTPIKVWKRPADDAYECIIINGHNRYEVAVELDIPTIPVQFVEFVSEDNAYLFIVNEQLGRRNLTPDEFRELLATKLRLTQKKPQFHGNQYTEVEHQNDALPKGKASAQVAKELGVSPSTPERALKARKDAISKLIDIGLPITDEIKEQLIDQKPITATIPNMETLATLNQENALEIFNKMVETNVLTIPEAAIEQIDKSTLFGKTEQQKEATRKAINKAKESCDFDLFGDCEEQIVNGELVAADKDVCSLVSFSTRNKKDVIANLKATKVFVLPIVSHMLVDEKERELINSIPDTKTLMSFIEQLKKSSGE
jgi:ParB-like chromosome segregation protein Spo0J